MALRYLYVIGGAELLQKAGLQRLSPHWSGDRVDLLAVGGDKTRDVAMEQSGAECDSTDDMIVKIEKLNQNLSST